LPYKYNSFFEFANILSSFIKQNKKAASHILDSRPSVCRRTPDTKKRGASGEWKSTTLQLSSVLQRYFYVMFFPSVMPFLMRDQKQPLSAIP